ncbi:MAG: hypothetical protein DRH10_03855 [Deltaproteobacteria bacterium]|nr:MAG: hypothetical protein DRH10_03855 [Deltaproteobacteria bacterium]
METDSGLPKGKTKEVGLVGRCHLAFTLVDFKLELLNGSVWERLRIFLKRKHSDPTRGSRRMRNKILGELGLCRFG